MSAVPRASEPDSPTHAAAMIVHGLDTLGDHADRIVAHIATVAYDEALEIERAAGEAGLAAYRVQCAARHRMLRLAQEAAIDGRVLVRDAVATLCRDTSMRRTQLYDDALVHEHGLLGRPASGTAATLLLDEPSYYREAVHTPDPAAFVEEVARRRADDATFTVQTARALAKRYRAAAATAGDDGAAARRSIEREDAAPITYPWTLEASDGWPGAATVDLDPTGLTRLGLGVGSEAMVTVYADYIAIRRA